MGRQTKTRSGRWEVKGNPNHPQAKWEHKPGEDDWTSKGTGPVSIERIVPWVNDMEEWSEMMYEAVLELRERMSAIEGLRHELHELSEVVKGGLKPRPKKRPPAARSLQSRGAK